MPAPNEKENIQSAADDMSPNEPPIRVMALHALFYCERLFYLEEVEEIRVADAAVYAGRRLHDDVAGLNDETPEKRSYDVASDDWGIYGKVDALRRRDGVWVAYEHKRGRCRRGDDEEPLPWPNDRIQAIAYAVLLEEELCETVPQARVRYHADNVTAFVDIDDAARQDLKRAIDRARELRRTTQRPPVAENENLCKRCSLNVVCLPEEERLGADSKSAGQSPRPAPTIFPSNRERQTLHIVSPKTRLSKSGQTLMIVNEDEKEKVPVEQVDAVLVHGFAQVTTQAIHLCARHEIPIQWMTAGGKFIAGTSASPGRVQQRIRQYEALTDETTRLRLARQLMHAKVETQLRYILRATRGDAEARQACEIQISRIRQVLKKIPAAQAAESLLGYEGTAARACFACLTHLLNSQCPEELQFNGRVRRPPRDRFNCLLSFGYALIQTVVHRSLLAVGLEPAFGFYHRPRSAAPPLMLDLMELFRTPLWEMPLIASINRGQWDIEEDFEIRPGHVWMSNDGKKKAIQIFEHRLQESYKHPYTGQSLSYARMVELEARLLEKEWTGSPGLFAQMRLR